MPHNQAWPENLALRLDERSLCGFAKLQRGSSGLQVFVPFTSPKLTKTALAQAAMLTRNLRAQITLFAVHVVPFPVPLDKPNVSAAFLERKLVAVARGAGSAVRVRVAFARDAEYGYHQVLIPNSLVVMASQKRWWPTAEVKLARSLVRAGHSVALLEV